MARPSGADSVHLEINAAIGAARGGAEVLAIARACGGQMNIVNAVTSLQRLAKLCGGSAGGHHRGSGGGGGDGSPTARWDRGDLAVLAARTVRCFGSERCQPRHVSGCLWAVAKLEQASQERAGSEPPLLGSSATGLVRAALKGGRQAPMRPEWFKPQEGSMAVWALGKLAQAHGAGGGGGDSDDSAGDDTAGDAVLVLGFVRWLLPSALARPSEFDPQGLANIVAGIAALAPLASLSSSPPSSSPPPPERSLGVTQAQVASCLRGRLSGFSPQELTNTLSALAKLGLGLGPGLGAEAAAAGARMLGRFEPQHLANAAWACAKLLDLRNHDAGQPQQPEAAGQRGGDGGGGGGPTPADRRALDFWAWLAPACAARAAEFNGPELSMCCWAAAATVSSSSSSGGSGCSGSGGSGSGAVDEALSPLEAAVAAFAVAAGRAAGALASGGGLEPQQLAMLVLALTKLGCGDRPALRDLSRACRRLSSTKPPSRGPCSPCCFSPQDLDNIGSGFARHELRWRSAKLVRWLAEAGAAAVARGVTGHGGGGGGGSGWGGGGGGGVSPKNLANLLAAVAKLQSICKEKRACGGGSKALSSAAVAVFAGPGSDSVLAAFNLKDAANAAWGLSLLGPAWGAWGGDAAADAGAGCWQDGDAGAAFAAALRALGTRAASLLTSAAGGGGGDPASGGGVCVAQETSRLLFALAKGGVECPELERAAGQQRQLAFAFPAPVGAVWLTQAPGGTKADATQREGTGAIAGNG